MSALNPLDRGMAYGWTDSEFEVRMPEASARWRSDVRHTRFPGGESFHDLFQRIEPLLIELEQQTGPVLVVSHLSVLQALASYFTGDSLGEALNSSIPHHTVLQLTPSPHTMMWRESLSHSPRKSRDDARLTCAVGDTKDVLSTAYVWRRLVARDLIRDADMLTVSTMASPKMCMCGRPHPHSSGNASVAMGGGAAGVCLEALYAGVVCYHH